MKKTWFMEAQIEAAFLFNLEDLFRMDKLNGSIVFTGNLSLIWSISKKWIKSDNWQRNGWTNTTTDELINLSTTWYQTNGEWNNLKQKLLTNKLELKWGTYKEPFHLQCHTALSNGKNCLCCNLLFYRLRRHCPAFLQFVIILTWFWLT